MADTRRRRAGSRSDDPGSVPAPSSLSRTTPGRACNARACVALPSPETTDGAAPPACCAHNESGVSGTPPSQVSSSSASSRGASSVNAPAPASPPARPPSELELKVRAIQKSKGTTAEKGAAIHALFAAQREIATAGQRREDAEKGVFPGPTASRGCEHYARNCWIKAACCGRFYPCRRCHDEAEDHEIDRSATETVACCACGDASQPVAAACRTCGVKFARYFCKPCRLYDDSPTTNAYHCAQCGICRVGRGLGIDNHHCERCNACVPLDAKDTHPCRERNLDSNCPICGQYLATSTDPTIFLKCSHPMHVACLEKHMTRSYVCPVCSKCIPEKAHMNQWYRKLDARLALDKNPEGYRNRVSKVFCNDCETKTIARFHFQFHRCKDCAGYNTRVLEQYDVAPEDLPPPITPIDSKLPAPVVELPPPPAKCRPSVAERPMTGGSARADAQRASKPANIEVVPTKGANCGEAVKKNAGTEKYIGRAGTPETATCNHLRENLKSSESEP